MFVYVVEASDILSLLAISSIRIIAARDLKFQHKSYYDFLTIVGNKYQDSSLELERSFSVNDGHTLLSELIYLIVEDTVSAKCIADTFNYIRE